MAHRTTSAHGTATYARTGSDDGWYVTHDGTTLFYADTGGSWDYKPAKGMLGAQVEGRLDVRAPRDPAAMRRFVRARMS